MRARIETEALGTRLISYFYGIGWQCQKTLCMLLLCALSQPFLCCAANFTRYFSDEPMDFLALAFGPN